VSGDLVATPVYATTADGDAFNGGSGLRLTGPGPGEEGLYETNVRVAAGSRTTVAFVAKTTAGPRPYVRLRFSDGTSATVQSKASGAGWHETMAPIEAQGKTIVGISVGFPSGNGPTDTVLGQLRVYDANTAITPSPIDVVSDGPSISWAHPSRPAIAYWNVYRSSGRCVSFVGPAFTNRYDVSQPMFPGPRAAHFVVQPVSTSGSAAKAPPICSDGS
jgi:hypothetical protein